MDRIPKKTNPYLFDALVANIQDALAERFPWLDHSFGIAEMLTEMKDGVRFTSANLYLGNDQYEMLMPCEEIGNFSLFVLKDPQVINDKVISAPFSFIIWYKVDEVSSSPDERNREAIKAQILAFFKDVRTKDGRVVMNRVYERPQNVFVDFTYDFVKNQFLMSPFAGLRIDGEMSVNIPCIKGGDFNKDYNNDFRK